MTPRTIRPMTRPGLTDAPAGQTVAVMSATDSGSAA